MRRAFLASLWLVACGGATSPSPTTVVSSEADAGGDAPGTSVLQCQPGFAVCGGVCTNLQQDSNHCGKCGNACSAGTVCSSGVCVPQPTMGGGGEDSGLPPDPGGPEPEAGAPTVNMAISLVRYGDTDTNGVASTTAWQLYGLDLDGKATTAQSTNVCTLAPGAPKSAQVDGPNGIDNSFGENILPILQTISASFSQNANANLIAGDATPIISIPDLGAGQDYAPLAATVYRAAPTSGPPAWNGTDVRSYDVGTAPVMFDGYMNQRTWVGTPPATSLAFDMHDFMPPTMLDALPPLPLSYVQLEMLVEPNGLSASAGIVGAVVSTKAMVAWLQSIAGTISTSLCSGSAFQSIAMQIEQASDIVLNPDGSVSNHRGTACNAISIGLGFQGTAVQLGGPVAVAAPSNACP